MTSHPMPPTAPTPAPVPVLEARIDVTVGSFHLDLELTIGAGEVVAVLGPNGAGKSTTLRVLAGLLALDGGRLVLDGRTIDDPEPRTFVRPEDRSVSVVFQDYRLFPHLNARDNVAFGLRASGTPRAAARAEADRWLERFGLTARADQKPRHLSGGQAQRVALARALAPAPRLLLLDEPLAALDVGTRTEVRRDLRRHLDQFAGATVLVTHDPLDAIALASRVVILEDGLVSQSGSIQEITERPTSRYVADLIGLNLLRGDAHGTTVTVDGGDATLTTAESNEGAVHALIHPSAVALHTARPDGSPRNQWPGRIEGFDLLGDRVRVRVRIGDGMALIAEVTPAAVTALDLREGSDVWTVVKATEITTYPR